MKSMPSKSHVRDIHVFRNQELTVVSLPPDEIYLIVSRRGPEIECIGVSHGEHGQVMVDSKGYGPDVVLATGGENQRVYPSVQ